MAIVFVGISRGPAAVGDRILQTYQGRRKTFNAEGDALCLVQQFRLPLIVNPDCGCDITQRLSISIPPPAAKPSYRFMRSSTHKSSTEDPHHQTISTRWMESSNSYPPQVVVENSNCVGRWHLMKQPICMLHKSLCSGSGVCTFLPVHGDNFIVVALKSPFDSPPCPCC